MLMAIASLLTIVRIGFDGALRSSSPVGIHHPGNRRLHVATFPPDVIAAFPPVFDDLDMKTPVVARL
jgi:hypothetical protein